MSEKNLAKVVQESLNRNGKPFMKLSALPKSKLGLKSNSTISQTYKFLEAELGDSFIFAKNGRSVYILKPCDPAELVLAELSKTVAKSPKVVAKSLGFLKRSDFVVLLNELINSGKIKATLTADFEPRIMLVEENKTHKVTKSEPTSKNYTQEEFKRAFDELDKGKIFVRICDLRRELNWPRNVFDEMIKNLRDREVIQLHAGDTSLMTSDEFNDCFVDENNFRMGTVTWYAR